MTDRQTPPPLGDDLSEGDYQRLKAALELVAQGQARAAVPVLQELRERAHQIDAGLGALVGSHLAEAFVASGQRSQAVQVLGEDAAKVRDPSYADVRARLLAQAAPLHPDEEFALQLASEADRLAAALEDPLPRLQTMGVLLALLERGGHEQGVQIVAESLADYARRLGDGPAEVQARLVLVRHFAAQEQPLQALEEARLAHAAAQLLSNEYSQLRGRSAAERGRWARQQGHLLEAVEALELALADLQPPDDAVRLERALAAAGLGLEPQQARAELEVLAHSSDTAVARRAQRASLLGRISRGELTEVAALPELAEADRPAVLAQLALQQGQGAEALAQLRGLAQRSPGDWAVGLLLAQALRMQGESMAALQRLDELVDRGVAGGDGWLELRARLQRAPLLGELGDHEASRQDARRAAEVAEALHLPLHHVAARTLVAQALARLELVAEAVAELDRAAQHAAQVGATAAAVRAALLGALLDPAPVRDALAWRPLHPLDSADQVDPPGLAPAVLLVLARRALEQDGDLQEAENLLNRAAQLDAGLGGRLSGLVGGVREQLSAARRAS
jgi:hypothetical protein